MLDKVIATLKLIPGAGAISVTANKVQAIYDVITNRKAIELDRELADYKRKVNYLNKSLRRIDAGSDDARRARLFADYRKTAQSVSNYGTALIDDINAYNALAAKIEQLTVNQISPSTISVAGLPKLEIPTLSGLGLAPLVVIPIAAAVAIGVIALVLYKAIGSVESYMHYDLKRKGIKEGMDRQYEGFTGGIQSVLEKTGGMFLTVGLIGAAGFIGYLAVKRYLPKLKKT
jgi:hypothetical protein